MNSPRALVSKGKLINRPKSAIAPRSNNNLVKANSPFGFHLYSRGSVVGVGRSERPSKTFAAPSVTKTSVSEKTGIKPINLNLLKISIKDEVEAKGNSDFDANDSYYSQEVTDKFPSINPGNLTLLLIITST